MKISIYDLIVLFFMNMIGGFVILYFLVGTMVPTYQSWEFVVSTFIFSICVAYVEIRLVLLGINYISEKEITG